MPWTIGHYGDPFWILLLTSKSLYIYAKLKYLKYYQFPLFFDPPNTAQSSDFGSFLSFFRFFGALLSPPHHIFSKFWGHFYKVNFFSTPIYNDKHWCVRFNDIISTYHFILVYWKSSWYKSALRIKKKCDGEGLIGPPKTFKMGQNHNFGWY